MKLFVSQKIRQWLVLPALIFLLPGITEARVLEVKVLTRTPVLNGRDFIPAPLRGGQSGSYEWITGTIIFGTDPTNPANSKITDLTLAPRKDGLVISEANFALLKPVDPAQAPGTMLVEVSNRGGMFSMRYFNGATKRGMDPSDPACFGDALLLKKGISMLWIGWEFDVPDLPGLFRIKVPVARHADGSPITGLVRSDWTVDKPVQVLKLGHRNQISYPVADFEDSRNVLTVRDGRESERHVVPRDQWRFAVVRDGRVVADSTHIYAPEGFEAGKIYELVYVSSNPPVVGLGLTAIRDIISYAKYGNDSLFRAKYGIATGVSQTGRFLRHFLYQGLNQDEQGRKAYDGMMIITAGAGRGSFNHRFAQPSRDAHRYSAFFYPTDIFPFTSAVETDPLTGRNDGLLANLPEPFRPKTFYVNTGYEYWGRAASLIHTSPDGTKDVDPLPNERIYHICSGQHFPGRFPPNVSHDTAGIRLYRGNPVNFYPTYRALVIRLAEWVREDQEPPPSVYPRLSDSTLVRPDALSYPVPALKTPAGVEVAYRMDYGPQWQKGIVDHQPPERGEPFPVFVPAIDRYGNEVAGIRNVEVEVPLATYLPWNLRWGYPAATGEMTDFAGTMICFSVEQGDYGNPVFKVPDLYPTKEVYMAKVQEATMRLARAGFLLSEDIPAVRGRAADLWKWIHSGK